MHRYSVDIAWSGEDAEYVATVPEFPNLLAFGETPEEALSQARDALEGFVALYKEDGIPLPEPRKRSPMSGQLRLRMPRTLHHQLSVMAECDGVSLNQLLVSLISEAYGYRMGARAVDTSLTLDWPRSSLLCASVASEEKSVLEGLPPQVRYESQDSMEETQLCPG